MTEWYYALPKTNERHGPVSTPALRAMIHDGRLPQKTLVWRQGLAGWIPAPQILPPTPSPHPTPRGLRASLMFAGFTMILCAIPSSLFLIGIPLLIAGIATLQAAASLQPTPPTPPFYARLRLAFASLGCCFAALLSLLLFLPLLPPP